MLAARPGRQLPAAVRRLGAGRPVELPADRLLVPQARRAALRRQEGVHGQPRRRRRLRARDHGHLGRHRARSTSASRSTCSTSRDAAAIAVPDRPSIALLAVRRRRRQERPVPAARLAARRDGRPDAGLRADPRGDDGHRRRLPRRPRQPAVRQRAAGDGRRRRRSASSRRILAASIALTQTDIKRVLAYSTLSASSATCSPRSASARSTAAIFHLMTHAFFKALLFLGSGSVIHARPRRAGHAPDGRPAQEDPASPTGRCSSARSPSPASRRWPASSARTRSSARRSSSASTWVWAIGVVVAVMTAFYMFRLIGLTFWGESRVDPHGRAEHPRVAADR